jgi:hypothetical protein
MQNSKLIYVIAAHPGSVDIGFRHDLTDGSPENFFDLPLRERSDKYLERLTAFGRSFVQRLSRVEGIRRVNVYRNDIHIDIGSAYGWRGDLSSLVREAIGLSAVDEKMTAVERRKRKPKVSSTTSAAAQ